MTNVFKMIPEKVKTILLTTHKSINWILKEMETKIFIVLFERDSKTIYRSLLQNFYICLIWWDILTEIFSCPPSWIFVDMHDNVTTGVTQFFFLTTQWLIFFINHTHGKCFGLPHGPKRFHKYFIGGKYLGEALNGLSLLWRHQNIVNEVKN